MILADKIILLRKKNGWSQEQLAEQMNISRQSVSKWESGASIPDIDKIIVLSKILGVSTDYLLKDEMEDVEFVGGSDEPGEEAGRSVSVEEANTYMDISKEAAPKMALATVLCILSPICLIILGALAEYKMIAMTEEMAGGIGLIILLLFIIPAVMIFIWKGMQMDKFEYLEKEKISLQYGVQGIVEKRKNDFDTSYRKSVAAGTALCIAAAIPIFGAMALNMSDVVCAFCVGGTLLLVACGVFFFVWSGTIQESFEKLLEEGDYTSEKKENRKYIRIFAAIYWCIITAIYLCMILPASSWQRGWRDDVSWIIWPVAALLFVAILGVIKFVIQRKKEKNA